MECLLQCQWAESMSRMKFFISLGKKLIRILHQILTVCAVLLLLVCAGLGGMYLYGIRPYVVRSGSMSPAIPVGSVCFVNHNVHYPDVTEQEIIAFSAGEMLVTHRAVSVTEKGIVTQGDANAVPDAVLVTEENFQGKTVYVIPKAGGLIEILQSKRGRMIGITLAIAVFLAGFWQSDTEKRE